MKNLKWVLCGILLVGMQLTSCKKDAGQQYQQNARAENKEKPFEKSITIYNADKTKSTTLRLRADSKELLQDKSLEKTEFTLVKTPVSAEATDLDTSAIRGDGMGYVASSFAKNAPQSTNKEQALPGDPGNAIQVDFPLASKTEPIFIEVNSKAALNNGTMRSAKEPVNSAYWWDSHLFYSGLKDDQRQVRVNDYGGGRIDVYPYYYLYGSGWIYQQPWYMLLGGDMTYRNCYHPVGADIYWHSPKKFTVGFFPSCHS